MSAGGWHSDAVSLTRRLTPPERYAFGPSVRPLLVPKQDPCGRFDTGGFWLAMRTPAGPASLSLTRAVMT